MLLINSLRETSHKVDVYKRQQVLTHRGVRNVTNERYLASTLEKEYIREFWGEGQLFFYYKRLKYPSIHRADDATYNVMKQMTLSDYQLLIPEEESKYN